MLKHGPRRPPPGSKQRLAGLVLALGMIAPRAFAVPESAPVIDVVQDGHGASGVVHGSVDIDAPRATVWRVLLDCAEAPRLMVNLKSCRVTRQDLAAHWDEREQITKGSLLPGIRTVIHADYDPEQRIRFHRVGGDFKVLEGEWRLESLDGGARTRVSYDSRVTPSFLAPGAIVRSVLRHDMPLTLAHLRDACEAEASAPAGAAGRP